MDRFLPVIRTVGEGERETERERKRKRGREKKRKKEQTILYSRLLVVRWPGARASALLRANRRPDDFLRIFVS